VCNDGLECALRAPRPPKQRRRRTVEARDAHSMSEGETGVVKPRTCWWDEPGWPCRSACSGVLG
jgi:hypothetical protein